MAAHRRDGAASRSGWGWKSMPATASTTPTAETIAALPEIVELNIGHFLIGRGDVRRPRRSRAAMRAAMDAGAMPRAGRMIIGIGSDLDRYPPDRAGDRAPWRPLPQPHLHRRRAGQRRSAARNGIATYAKRFAAKEACAKALGTGIRRGVWWRDMGVVNLPSGRPDHEADRRGAGPAGGAHARGLRRGSICRSPTNGRWRRPSS